MYSQTQRKLNIDGIILSLLGHQYSIFEWKSLPKSSLSLKLQKNMCESFINLVIQSCYNLALSDTWIVDVLKCICELKKDFGPIVPLRVHRDFESEISQHPCYKLQTRHEDIQGFEHLMPSRYFDANSNYVWHPGPSELWVQGAIVPPPSKFWHG